MGKSSINGPFSTAMLNNQRVPLETLKDTQIMYGPVVKMDHSQVQWLILPIEIAIKWR